MKLVLLAASAALFVAAGQARDPVVLHPLMKDIVAPQAQVLWDVGNRGMDDDGKPDVSKLSGADWDKLAKAAQAMKETSIALAEAPRVAVTAGGAKIQDEGSAGALTAQQIQRIIDADPKGFASAARALATVSDGFLDAARGRDAAKLMEASGGLDQACEACHLKFWYPEQGGAGAKQ
jgi:cytochrome c556